MSNIIMVGEHAIVMPPVPKVKNDVLFVNEKDPYWRRDILLREYRDIWFNFIPYYTKIYQDATLYDQDEILISLNKEDSDYIVRIYEQEIRRRTYGVWFFNGTELTWITGDHYFALMWCKMQRHDGLGSYADYREFQRDYFYLIHHCNISPHILGAFVTKPKKTGITNLHWLYYLNKATMTKNKNLGYMNIEQGQAAKTFRDYFLYSYNGLIPAQRPQYKNKSENEGSIILGKSYGNSKKAKLLAYDTEDELNTSVFCVPTKDKAFDVAVMSDICMDEPTKYKQPFGEIFRTNKEAVKIQSKINGKAWLFNYNPEGDTESFKQAREIFFDSELKTIRPDANGQTKSGLICHHIPSYAAWEGAFDKHGKCDEQRAYKEIQRERDKVAGNPRALQAITRQYANTKRESWASGGAGSTFDNIRLGDLLADLEIDQRSNTENNYLEGKLEWSNSLWELGSKNKRPKGQFCPVNFVPLTEEEMMKGVEGRIRFYNTIPVQHQNMALKNGRDEWGNLLPPPVFFYFLGGDPANYAAGSEVTEGSKNAYMVKNRRDEILDTMMGKVSSNVLMVEYHERPELPNEAYEDLVKLIIFLGPMCIVEANAPFAATSLMEEGLGNYMIIKNKEGVMMPWKRWMGLAHEEKKEYKLIRMTANQENKEMLETIVRLIKNYFRTPQMGEKDYGKTFKSERALKQKMDFDPLDTKKFDLVMSEGYMHLAEEVFEAYLMTNQEDINNPMNLNSVLSALAS